jgi:hypothetical protein
MIAAAFFSGKQFVKKNVQVRARREMPDAGCLVSPMA